MIDHVDVYRVYVQKEIHMGNVTSRDRFDFGVSVPCSLFESIDSCESQCNAAQVVGDIVVKQNRVTY